MEGHEKLGRGAVFVVDRPSANIGIQTSAGVQDGIPSMYVSLSELERRDATVHSEMGKSFGSKTQAANDASVVPTSDVSPCFLMCSR